jgi:hypothetical protein
MIYSSGLKGLIECKEKYDVSFSEAFLEFSFPSTFFLKKEPTQRKIYSFS